MKIRSVILCDDIRQEKNNKHILIGVYGPSIRIAEIPGAIPLAYFVQIEASKYNVGDEVSFEVEVRAVYSDNRKNNFLKGGAKVTLIDDVIATLAIPILPAVFEDECEISLRIKEKGKRWVSVISTKVVHDPSLRPAS